MKTVIFNVGGALSAYVEFGEKKVVIDLGKSGDFSPVNDFLLPLFQKREEKNPYKQKSSWEKFYIDQLILSHPHKDHISDIQDFEKHFKADLLTTPNSREDKINSVQHINWNHITTPDDENVVFLKNLTRNRNPPLRETHKSKMKIAYLYPKSVEDDKTLDSESYTNNISIATYIYEGYGILFPGDIQKEGMDSLLNGKVGNHQGKALKRELLTMGLDFLVAPHHGLQSSFSTDLFSAMKGGMTRKLNIVSEKPNTDDNRNVDTRYATTTYCAADNNLSTKDSPACQRKTSNGHIFIDDNGTITIDQDINKILELFD